MTITASEIKKVSAYSGFGINEIKTVVESKNLNILQACWYLYYASLAVNYRGDREKWNIDRAIERAIEDQINYDEFKMEH